MSRGRRAAAELAVGAGILAVAAALRVVHLGTPSLWWDELVEIRTADRPLPDLLRIVRQGVIPGSGNAGAMPASYLVLHAHLRTTAPPAPEQLEAYFRAPACAASIAAVAVLYGLGRAVFGRTTGALAAWLLAISLPAILYAAEARSYSLLTLTTALDVAAFAGVVAAPDRAARWMLYVVASALYFLTGIFALFVIAVQYAVLAVVAWRARGRAPGPAGVIGSALVVAGLVLGYLVGTPYGATYPRRAVVEPLAVTWEGLRFLAADVPAVLVTTLAAAPFAIAAAARRGRGAVAWACVLAFTALPAIALVIRWKEYYFHPRHVLFLLPLFVLVLAAGSLEIARRLDPFCAVVRMPRRRRALEATAVGLLLLGLALPGLRQFVGEPHGAFARTKTLRDVGPVVRVVADRVARLQPGEQYLLLAERNSTANAVLSAYLGWYGLTDRVTLRSPGVPLDRVEAILRAHGGDPQALALRPAHGLFFGFRGLLGLERPIGEVPPRVSRLGLVGYAAPPAGPDVHRFHGVTLREPAARASSRDRS